MDYLKGSIPIDQFLGNYKPPEEEDQNDSIFGDIGTGLKQGVTTDLAHTVTGLVDLAGSAVGADVSATAAADKAGLADLEKSYYNELTPETKEALRKVEEAEGFWGTLGAYASNPRAIAYDVARALPMSLAGGGLGAAGAKGAAKLAGTATAKNAVKKELLGSTSAKAANYWAAGGEGLVGAGMSASSIAQYNAANPETRDPLEGVGYAALTGLGTGLVAGTAGRIGGSVESAVFNKSIRETMANKPWASVGKSAVTEGIEEAAQAPTETVPQNWAEDKPWNEDLGQNIAQSLIAGSAMGGGAHGAMRALRFASPGDGRPQVSQEPVDVNQAASGATMSMEGATPVEGVIQQGDQAVPVQNVASAEAAPTQMVPVGETPPATLDAEEAASQQRRAEILAQRQAEMQAAEEAKAAKEAEKLAAKQAREDERLAKAEQKRQVKAEIAQRKADEKKAKEDEFQQARARYLDIFGVPEDQRERYKKPVALDAVRKHYDKEGYAPAAKALREANEALGSRDFDNVNKLVPALNGISENATTSAEFADRFDGLAKQYAKSNPKKAEVYTLAAQAMRSPDKSMADVFDAYQRKQAFDRFEAANQAAPKNLPTYDVYDFRAGNVKNGVARVKVNIRGNEVILNGQVRKHQFFPNSKQFNDFADYVEGVRGNHQELYDEVTSIFNTENEVQEPAKSVAARAEALPNNASEGKNGAALVKQETGVAKTGTNLTRPEDPELDVEGLTVGEGVVLRMLSRMKAHGENDESVQQSILDYAKSLTPEELAAFRDESESLLEHPTEHKEFYSRLGGEGVEDLKWLLYQHRKSSVSEVMGTEDDTVGTSGKQMLARLENESTEEEGKASKERESKNFEVTSDVGQSSNTDEDSAVRRFFGKALYKRLLNSEANRGSNKRRIIPVDSKHKENPLRDGSLEKLEAAMKTNPALADEVEAALTGQEGLDALEVIRGIKNPVTAAKKALETLASLNRIATAGNIDTKKLEPLVQELYNIYARGQTFEGVETDSLVRPIDWTRIPFLGRKIAEWVASRDKADISTGYPKPFNLFGEPPVFRINFNAIRKVKAETKAGREIQKDCYFIADPLTEGLAVPVKTILEKCNNPKEDLKGLFSDRFINYVVPAVKRMYTTRPYKLNDNLVLVDGGRDVVELVKGNRRWEQNANHGEVTNMPSSRFVLEIPLDGTSLPMPRFRSKQEFLSAYLKGAENKPFLEYLPYHELLHVNCRAVGTKRAHDVVERNLSAIESAFRKIRQMTPADVKGYNHPGGVSKELMDNLAYCLEYPEIARNKAEPKSKHYKYINETYATLLGLYESDPVFVHLLNTPEFKELADVVREAIYVGSIVSDNGRGTRDHTQAGGGSGDSGQGLSDVARTAQVPRREDRSVEESPSGRAVGAGQTDAGRSEAPTPTGSRSSQGQGLTQRTQKAIDAAIDKVFKRSPKWKARAKNVNHFLFRTALGGYFTRDVIKMAYDATGIDGFRHWGNVHEKINTLRNELLKDASAISNKAANLSKDQRDVVNEYIKDAVVQGAWGYWHKGVFKDEAAYNEYRDGLEDQAKYDAEIAMRRRWVKLNKAQREVISDVFEYGNKQLRERYRLLKEKLDEQRMPALEEQDGEIPENAQLEELRKEVDRLSKSPYVPLMRAGSHMVIFKSADYVAAEKELKAQEDVFNSLEKPTKEDRKRVQKAASALNALKSSGDDYAVEFVDGYGTAEQIAKGYESEYPGSKVVFGERLEELKDNVPGYKQLERAANMLAKSMEEGELADKYGAHAKSLAKELHAMISKMYIESLAETSAKKRMLKKRTVRGFNQNMIENLMAAAPSTANMLAFMRYSDEVAKAGREIDESIKKLQGDDFATARVFQSELIQRENLSTQQTSDAVNGVLRTASMMMLLTNPAYYLQNMTQSIMMSAPFMAQRHGAQIFKRLVSNTMEVAKWMKDDPTLEKLEKQMLDESVKNKPLTMDEWKALDHSRRHGHLDIGMTQDFGDVNRGGGKVRDTAVRVSDKLNKMARQVEMLNRVSTFLTAYRAEIMRGQSPAKAREYADDVIYQTHGDYSAFNAPKWFTYNGLTRVMTQFRKFQLIQAGLMTRLAANSFKGATPEVRAEARRQFAYMLATHMAFTGMKGTPFATVLLGIAAMGMGETGDDGEDLIRKMIGDKDMSNLLMRGVPAWLGMDVSGKIGAENMLSPMPYMNAKFSDGRDGANELIAGALGPAASLVQKFYTAGQYFIQGDEWKALEYALPNGLATNLSKGVRFMTEGYSSKAGDVLVKPQDYDVGDFLIQTLGFQPRVMTDRMRVQDSLIRHKESFDAEKNRIYMDFKKARREGDHAGMNQARREMLKLAAEARKQGLTGYTIQNMINAANEQRRRERQAVGGVGTNKNDRQFVKKMSEV